VITRILVTTASSVLEMATGVALIANPDFVIRLLIGAQLSDGGVAVARICGFGLLALGLASLPLRNQETTTGDRSFVRLQSVFLPLFWLSGRKRTLCRTAAVASLLHSCSAGEGEE
jgi:hypothetical protein